MSDRNTGVIPFPTSAPTPTKKTAVLLLGFGGPDTLSDVRPFLRKVFSDPAIFVGIPAPIRILLAWIISTVKARESRDNYRRIGGGSPQLAWTFQQAMNLFQDLKAQYDLEPWDVVIGMRYSRPTIFESIRDLKTKGIERIILMPLFPQFSTTTTGSCFTAVHQALEKLHWKPEITTIDQWCEDPGYLDLFASLIADTFSQTRPDLRGHVIFSAHSLPLKIVERGDPYADQILKTVRGLQQRLPQIEKSSNWNWSLAYQSRNGKLPWLEPYLEDEIPRVIHGGAQQLMIVPVSFVADHIETLWELDILYRRIAEKSGVTEYFRVPTFNGEAAFGNVLGNLVRNAAGAP